jgi:hypothetical protein
VFGVQPVARSLGINSAGASSITEHLLNVTIVQLVPSSLIPSK